MASACELRAATTVQRPASLTGCSTTTRYSEPETVMIEVPAGVDRRLPSACSTRSGIVDSTISPDGDTTATSCALPGGDRSGSLSTSSVAT